MPPLHRKIIAGWVCIAWALWFGGLGALFLFVKHLFTIDHDLAVKTAPHLFEVFERYQILLAALSLIATAAWRFMTGSPRVTALFYVFAVASVGAALGPPLFTHPMLNLISQGKSSSPEFRRLHGESMGVYSAETLVLLIAGFALPWALQPDVSKETARAS